MKREALSAEAIADRIRSKLFASGGAGEDFLAYADKCLQGYLDRGQIATYKAYRTAVRKLRDFMKSKLHMSSLSFDMLAPDLIRSFETYLIKDLENATNTVHKNVTSIRTILYQEMGSYRRAATHFST